MYAVSAFIGISPLLLTIAGKYSVNQVNSSVKAGAHTHFVDARIPDTSMQPHL